MIFFSVKQLNLFCSNLLFEVQFIFFVERKANSPIEQQGKEYEKCE